MVTVLKLGPGDHGRAMALEDFLAGDFEEGYQYELIDGKLYVSPEPNLPQDWVEKWIYRKLLRYSEQHPEAINYVSNKARVFIPSRARATCPQPDLAAYRNFPLHRPIRELRWQEVSPVLVGEVLSLEDPDKDLVRNVELYLQVPSIKEYWLFDTREDPEQPTLRVHRRHGKRWRLLEFSYGATYTTRLLPGFALAIDPRS